jgi:G6PDH family F420-dependent oxidoreductase
LTPCGYPTTSTWLDEQGQSGFVWSMIGAISQVTSLPITTAVTSPLLRLHPAIVAQATATSSLLTGGGFTLGVGSGEALNEHILGGRWPSAEQRLEMLEEAVGGRSLAAATASRWRAPSTGCGQRSGMPTPARPSWPTGSPAALR